MQLINLMIEGNYSIINMDNVNYISNGMVYFNNGSTVKVDNPIDEISFNLKTDNYKKYNSYDPNRLCTDKQLSYAKSISTKLGIQMPPDTKFNTIRKFIDDNAWKINNPQYDKNVSEQPKPIESAYVDDF